MSKYIPLTKLGSVTELVMGQAPSAKDCNKDGLGTPFVKVGEFGAQRPVIREWTTDPKKLAQKEDLLICVVGATCGKINLGENCAIGRSVAAIRPNEGQLLQLYLHYFMMGKVEEMRAGSQGAAQTVISKNMINDVLIPLPDLTEQQCIVGILDEAFERIATATANAEQNLKNARELFVSHLKLVFESRDEGWETKRVADIADCCLGKMLDKQKNKGTAKPYLRNLNVQWFDIGLSDVREMRFEESEHERYAVKKGDLLICEGGYPGRAAIWEHNEEIYFQKALHRVRCYRPEYNRWLLYYFYLSDSTGDIKQHFTGAGIQHLTGKALKKLIIPVPPSDRVGMYIEKFDYLFEQVGCLEAIYEQKLDALAELKQSLLQKAFAGELH